MKEKNFSNFSNPCFPKTFQPRCLMPIRKGSQGVVKRLFKRYEKEIDTICAVILIGIMFLVGIWYFLVQLSEYPCV